MGSENEVLDQADALMRRHRSFVARVKAQSGDVPPAVGVADEDSDADIPLLTEIVDSGVDSIASNPLDTARLLDELRADIEQQLSAWLVEELPAAVASASQSILKELDAKARHSLLPRLLALVEARRAAVPVPQATLQPSV